MHSLGDSRVGTYVRFCRHQLAAAIDHRCAAVCVTVFAWRSAVRAVGTVGEGSAAAAGRCDWFAA